MNDSDLLHQLLDYLRSVPPTPDYLVAEPDSTPEFDPYQMVAEWVALRHEVKQQGKLLDKAQMAFQQSLAALEVEKTELKSQLAASQQQAATQLANERTSQAAQFDQEQKKLLKDLLKVMDSLDHACNHWQEQQTKPQVVEAIAPPPPAPEPEPPSPAKPSSIWQQVVNWFTEPEPDLIPSASTDQSSRESMRKSPPESTSESLMSESINSRINEIIASNQSGLELIRKSLLETLQQRGVTPLNAEGNVFDTQTMYAIGRQESETLPENTVVQEVVRGYLWANQVLREAQVIVAVRSR